MKSMLVWAVAATLPLAAAPAFAADPPAAAPAPSLKIVIVRHGEKPAKGDNLSCQGLHRALALPKVLHKKFGTPDFSYAPKLKEGSATSHARMFQTITPYAVVRNLTVNTSFGEDDVTDAAKDVLTRTGLVLMVWEHSQIPPLAKALGIGSPPPWDKDDFDSIWVVTVTNGTPSLDSKGKEGLKPSSHCKF